MGSRKTISHTFDATSASYVRVVAKSLSLQANSICYNLTLSEIGIFNIAEGDAVTPTVNQDALQALVDSCTEYVTDCYSDGSRAAYEAALEENPVPTTANYTVEHWFENLDGSFVREDSKTENLTGTISETATADELGIINGVSGKLVPRGNVTRAQMATILMRCCEVHCMF